MNLNEERTELYDSFLIKEGITSSDFDISDDLVIKIFYKYVYPNTKLMYLKSGDRKHTKTISRQLNYTRLFLLHVKFKRNGNKASGIKEGFVYLVTNPAWPDKIKIGSYIDVVERLNVYQSYSPNRDYELHEYYFSHDRFKEEKQWHRSLCADGEWCKCELEPIRKLFKTKKLHSIPDLSIFRISETKKKNSRVKQ